MQVIDIVKPAPKTSLKAWERWLNRMTAEFQLAPWSGAKKIEVKYEC